MVHLATVKKDHEGSQPPSTEALPAIETLDLNAVGFDDFSSSVYGTRYAASALPALEMPEHEMPREVAYRMIKDDLSLDGNPMLKCVISRKTDETRINPSDLSVFSLASFVTTYMVRQP